MNPIRYLAFNIKQRCQSTLYKQENMMGFEIYQACGKSIYVSVANKRTRNGYSRWQWNLNPNRPQTDILILIAVDDQEKHPFIISGREVMLSHRHEITSHPKQYRGYLSEYLECWHAIKAGAK